MTKKQIAERLRQWARHMSNIADAIEPVTAQAQTEQVDEVAFANEMIEAFEASRLTDIYAPRPTDGPQTRRARADCARRQAQNYMLRAFYPWHKKQPMAQA